MLLIKCFALVRQLDTSSLRGAIQKLLDQSLLAGEAGDVELVLDLAQTAKQVAVECRDWVGEAIALVHLGTAYAQNNQHREAQRAFDYARRIFHRNPHWRQRLNEGIALFSLGLVFQLQSPPAPARALACYQQALDVLEKVRPHYVRVGEGRRVQSIQDLRDKLHDRIDLGVPQVYIEVRDYETSLLSEINEPSSPSYSSPGEKTSAESLSPSGESENNLEQGVYQIDDDDSETDEFQRDDKGKVRFVDSDG